jgi:3-dehydroquinate synthase
MKKINVPDLVEVTDDIFNQDNSVFAKVLCKISQVDSPRMFLLADNSVVSKTESLGLKIGKYIKTHSINLLSSPIVISCGEKIKTDDFSTFRSISAKVVAAGMQKNDILVALGGGSLFDVAGMVAAQVYGGIKFVKIPTTLSAMIDGAYATKASLNVSEVKDAVSVEIKADAVVVDTRFLSTLLCGVCHAGIAQMLRLGVSHDKAFVKKLFDVGAQAFVKNQSPSSEIIKQAIELRLKKGESDLGEWCSSILESLSTYKLPHGYAVAISTAIHIKYAALVGVIAQEEADTLISFLHDVGALESVMHSRHVISQIKKIVSFAEVWKMRTAKSFEMLAAVGKKQSATEIDIAKMEQAIADIISRESVIKA